MWYILKWQKKTHTSIKRSFALYVRSYVLDFAKKINRKFTIKNTQHTSVAKQLLKIHLHYYVIRVRLARTDGKSVGIVPR